jgi:hypothetical protein
MTKILVLAVAVFAVAGVNGPAGADDPLHTGIAPPTRIPPVPDATRAPTGTPVATTEIPRDLRRAIAADAARRFDLPLSAVVLTAAERVTWANASMGCPRPGQNYAAAKVAGFRVVARTSAGEFLYNTDAQMGFVVCPPVDGAR